MTEKDKIITHRYQKQVNKFQIYDDFFKNITQIKKKYEFRKIHISLLFIYIICWKNTRFY